MFGLADKVLAYILGGTSIALALALAGMFAFYKGETGSLREQVTAANARADMASKNSGTLQGGLDMCNASVAAWKAEGDKKTADTNAALAVLAPIVDKLHKSAIDIMKAKPGPDLCKSSDALILEHVQ